MIYDGREYDGGPGFRRVCLELALQAHRNLNPVSDAPDVVVETAKKFETYIKGETKEGAN